MKCNLNYPVSPIPIADFEVRFVIDICLRMRGDDKACYLSKQFTSYHLVMLCLYYSIYQPLPPGNLFSLQLPYIPSILERTRSDSIAKSKKKKM